MLESVNTARFAEDFEKSTQTVDQRTEFSFVK